jgi:hypothetical protein
MVQTWEVYCPEAAAALLSFGGRAGWVGSLWGSLLGDALPGLLLALLVPLAGRPQGMFGHHWEES